MPVQYSGIIAEHNATREAAGLFDVSHMGEIFITGEPKVILNFLESVTCNSVVSLSDFQVQYNAILNENGGLVDDVTIYKFSPEKYMICSNASNYEAVTAHLLKYLPASGIKVDDQSPNWHQIALQGPKANEILSKFLGKELDSIRYYHFALFRPSRRKDHRLPNRIHRRRRIRNLFLRSFRFKTLERTFRIRETSGTSSVRTRRKRYSKNRSEISSLRTRTQRPMDSDRIGNRLDRKRKKELLFFIRENSFPKEKRNRIQNRGVRINGSGCSERKLQGSRPSRK